jgi:hypothetical protein
MRFTNLFMGDGSHNVFKQLIMVVQSLMHIKYLLKASTHPLENDGLHHPRCAATFHRYQQQQSCWYYPYQIP